MKMHTSVSPQQQSARKQVLLKLYTKFSLELIEEYPVSRQRKKMVESLNKARWLLGPERFNKVSTRYFYRENPFTIPYRRLSRCLQALRQEYLKK